MSSLPRRRLSPETDDSQASCCAYTCWSGLCSRTGTMRRAVSERRKDSSSSNSSTKLSRGFSLPQIFRRMRRSAEQSSSLIPPHVANHSPGLFDSPNMKEVRVENASNSSSVFGLEGKQASSSTTRQGSVRGSTISLHSISSTHSTNEQQAAGEKSSEKMLSVLSESMPALTNSKDTEPLHQPSQNHVKTKSGPSLIPKVSSRRSDDSTPTDRQHSTTTSSNDASRLHVIQAATTVSSTSSSPMGSKSSNPASSQPPPLRQTSVQERRPTSKSVRQPRPISVGDPVSAAVEVYRAERKRLPASVPMFPMTSTTALQTFKNRLTEFEQDEVLDYPEVHYLGLEARKISAVRGAPKNHGFDEENGSYIIALRDHICYRYEMKEILGKGSFGHVVKALDHKTNQYVAIKVIRNKKRFHQQAQVELRILANLNKKDRDGSHHVIRMEDSFYFRNHLCISFELMGMNLYEVLKKNNFQGFALNVIRKITHSLLQCLKLLRRENIIHCDLKPENILLRPSGHLAVKVIDFGSSCYENQRVYTYIQSRFYRSPEVILGLAYTCAIDMWSLGCILPELYTGYPLFPGENESEQLACIMQVKGLPPARLLDTAPRRKHFFDSQGNPRNLVNSKGRRRQPGTRSLAYSADCSDALFLNFIQQCLHWEADQRMLPEDGLQHPWITQGRVPRVSTGGYASDSAALRPSRSARHSVSAIHHNPQQVISNHHSYSVHGRGSSGIPRHVTAQSMQRRPQPIGAEQPPEAVTTTKKDDRQVVGAATPEKTIDTTKVPSSSWANPSCHLEEPEGLI